ncbi:MAG: lipocalin family protein, partial [Dysgonamonadaceae bacterium]|nr:lipocalin family protein [Dysgonamonadaceae bacterium]
MKSTNKLLVTMLLIGLASIFSSCASIPKNAKPVQYFDVNRYLGIWYEIARFDFRYERNMDNTTAQYSLNKN